jgi:hypothetical protein
MRVRKRSPKSGRGTQPVCCYRAPMKHLLRMLLIGTMVASCSAKQSSPSLNAVRATQALSEFGPTTSWRLANVSWTKNTQAMRDRAYLFCLEVKPKDNACMTAQDYSLITANHAESNVANLSPTSDKISPYFSAIRQNPEAFKSARRSCLLVYVDAGSADARMIGPCFSSAVGADFFGIIPVQ